MQLHRIEKEIEDAGGRLVVVGNGQPNFMQGFREKSGYQGALYTDPGRKLYKALELRRGLRTALNMRSARRAFSAYRDGFRQTRTEGDAIQQGGVFVIGTGGESTYEYRSQYAGDHPSNEALLAAVARARAAGQSKPGSPRSPS